MQNQADPGCRFIGWVDDQCTATYSEDEGGNDSKKLWLVIESQNDKIEELRNKMERKSQDNMNLLIKIKKLEMALLFISSFCIYLLLKM